MIKIEFAQKTHQGQTRDHNEDSIFSDAEMGLWIVADGMGGHAGGEVASCIVCESIPEMIKEGHSLKESIATTHHLIKAAPQNGRGIKGMGSTVVAMKLDETGYQIAWVGDSRAYLWDGQLHQLSTDQSFVQKLIEAKAITPEQARNHPKKNLILQSLGASQLPTIQVDSLRGDFKKESIILLCSDGLNNELTDDEIAALIDPFQPLQSVAKNLVDAANKAGGNDNISVILIKTLMDSQDTKGKSGYLDRVKSILSKKIT
ncbi:MAG: hypothetical protein COW84_03260 [Gammaproteobacteria bacterium CG22_combo_CG10-13_8_21_14_all_40_8]|nr:MAG: hypothetical protein COW84_03260 [Gammaproteobacteria bacterium CG22_combo_CG10-13_8_21_14_all_40_8]